MMFKKRDVEMTDITNRLYEKNVVEDTASRQVNTILKGSKLTGDIHVSFDLVLSGEVEGNITSEKDSNVSIKGICKGNIKTEEGNVDIQGELSKGDVISGGDVRINGKFNGGKIEAGGRIFINGEFNGSLRGKEVEVGPNSRGKGEIVYREFISISKGAKVEVQINHAQEAVKVQKKTGEMKVVNLDIPEKDVGKATLH
jgi:cytoskeletal protein CcmA (bactofilin family)